MEFYHMSGVIHHSGMLRLWSSYTQPTMKGKPEPTAWLGQQRKSVSTRGYAGKPDGDGCILLQLGHVLRR